MLSLMPVHANGYSNGNAPAAARITTVPSYAAARHASCASATHSYVSVTALCVAAASTCAVCSAANCTTASIISLLKSFIGFLHIAGVYLPTPVFTHGQFYVASSRSGIADNLRYWIPDNPQYRHPDGHRAFITQNIVWPEILEAAISDTVQLPTSTVHSQPAATTTSMLQC